jgi:RecA/RadA recombinase
MAKAKEVDAFIRQATGDSRAESLAAVFAGGKKRFKKNMLCDTSDERLIVPRASSGLLDMDIKTNGGLPLGRILLVYGEKSGGKTALLLRGMASYQRLCANCSQPGVFKEGKMEFPNLKTGKVEKITTQVIQDCPCGKPKDVIPFWIDAEGVWDTWWASRLGVWTEKVMLGRPAFAEQGYDYAKAFLSTGQVDLIVVDSLAQMAPEAEYQGSMSDQQQGLAARVNNKFIRAAVGGINESFQMGKPMTVWLINQYRMAIGVMFGDPRVLPGGKGASFSSSMEIEMTPKKVTNDPSTGESLYGDFGFFVKRNKVGPPGGKGEFRQWMAKTDLFDMGDLYEHEGVIKIAADMGFVDRPNKTMYEWGGSKFRGASSLAKHFAKNSAEYDELKSAMLKLKLGLG